MKAADTQTVDHARHARKSMHTPAGSGPTISKDKDTLNRFVEALNIGSKLKQTVICYLVNDLDIAMVARVLFVHPDTARYRLKRVKTW